MRDRFREKGLDKSVAGNNPNEDPQMNIEHFLDGCLDPSNQSEVLLSRSLTRIVKSSGESRNLPDRPLCPI